MLKKLNIDNAKQLNELIKQLKGMPCFQVVYGNVIAENLESFDLYLNENEFYTYAVYDSENQFYNLIDLDRNTPTPFFLRLIYLRRNSVVYFEWLQICKREFWQRDFSGELDYMVINGESVFESISSLKTKTELLFNLDLLS